MRHSDAAPPTESRPGDTNQSARAVDAVKRNERWLRRLAFELTRNEDSASDLVQDTFVTLLRRPHEDDVPARAWFKTVLRNLHVDRVRASNRRKTEQLDDGEETRIPIPDRTVDAARLVRLLEEEIETLAEPFRTTLRLSYFEDLSSAEVAVRLKVPAATVRRRNQLALRQLRKRLGRTLRGEEHVSSIVARALAPFGFLKAGWHPLFGGASGTWRGHAALVLTGAAAVVTLIATGALQVTGRVAASTRTADIGAGTMLGVSRNEGAPPGQVSRASLNRATARSLTSPPRSPSQGLVSRFEGASQPPVAGTREILDAAGGRCPDLQALVDGTTWGTTLKVPACIYRIALRVERPMVLDAEPGTEIRGSDVWTDFKRSEDDLGPRWTSAASVPKFMLHWSDDFGDCETRTDGACRGISQVFRDGRPLERVGHLAVVGPDEFTIVEGRRVVLGADPAGHAIEVTTRQRWVHVRASDVTIRGFRMRHGVTFGDVGMLEVDIPHDRLTVTESAFSDTTKAAVALAGFDHVFMNNDIFNAGGVGLVLRAPHRIRVEKNRLFRNGLNLSSRMGWMDGGIKAFAGSGRIVGNDIFDNVGAGLFCAHCEDFLTTGNVMRGNGGAAVRYWGTARGHIKDNRMWQNGWSATPEEPSILVVRSRGVAISGNIVASSPGGVLVGPHSKPKAELDGGDPCAFTADNDVHANVLIGAGRAVHIHGGLPSGRPARAGCHRDRAHGNRLWQRSAFTLDPQSGTLFPMTDGEKAGVLWLAGMPADLE